jgi:hypothetical protein
MEKMLTYTGIAKPVVDFVSQVPKGYYASGLISAKLLQCTNRNVDLPVDKFYHVTYHYNKVTLNDVLTFIHVYRYLVDSQKKVPLSFTTIAHEQFHSREHPDATLWSVKSSTVIPWKVVYIRWTGWAWQPHITDYNNLIHTNDSFSAVFELTFSYHKHELVRRATTLDQQRFDTVISTLDKYM